MYRDYDTLVFGHLVKQLPMQVQLQSSYFIMLFGFTGLSGTKLSAMTEGIAISRMAVVQNEHDPTVEVPNQSGTPFMKSNSDHGDPHGAEHVIYMQLILSGLYKGIWLKVCVSSIDDSDPSLHHFYRSPSTSDNSSKYTKFATICGKNRSSISDEHFLLSTGSSLARCLGQSEPRCYPLGGRCCSNFAIDF